MSARIPPDAKGLRCPKCGNDQLDVRDSRPSINAVRRRRHCAQCGTRMTTFELMSPTGEDTARLVEALQLYDRLQHLPGPERLAIFALIKAVIQRPAPALEVRREPTLLEILQEAKP